MEILAVESEHHAADLLAVAIERGRPGTEVALFPDVGSATEAMARRKQDGISMPSLVVLGPCSLKDLPSGSLRTLRELVGPDTPVLAFAVDSQDAGSARAAGAEAVYEYTLDWPTYSGAVANLLRDWLARRTTR